MKLKKWVYVFIFSIFLLPSLFLVVNKKHVVEQNSVTVSNIKFNSLGTLDVEQSRKNGECDAFFDGTNSGIYQAKNGFPIYIVNNGCSVGIKYYIEKNSNKKEEACDALKSYLDNNRIYKDSLYEQNCDKPLATKVGDTYYSGNPSDNNYCETLKIAGYNGVLKIDDPRNTCGYPLIYVDGSAVTANYYFDNVGENEKNDYCSYIKGLLTNSYVKYSSLSSGYNEHCSPKTTDSNFISSVKEITEIDGSCANILNKYKGVLAPTVVLPHNTSANKCDYSIFYIDGNAWSLSDIFGVSTDGNSKTSYEQKSKICSDWKNNITREESDSYNDYCSNIAGDSGISTDDYIITFDANINSGDGLECSDGTYAEGNYTISSGTNQCIYRFRADKYSSGQRVTISLPNTGGLKQLGTGYTFKCWNNGSGCSNSNQVTLPIEKNISLVYSPEFNDDVSNASDGISYSIYNDCDGNISNKGINTSKTKSQVSTENLALSTNTIISKKNNISNNFNNNNNYCPVSCTENFNYYYPTIFETAKAGTYFKLLSYPKVVSSFSCSESFNKSAWENDYKNNLITAMKDYVDYKNSQSVNSISNATENSSCGCKNWSSNNGHSYCSSYYDKVDTTIDFYSYNSSTNTVTKGSKNISMCGNNLNDIKQKIVRGMSVYGGNLSLKTDSLLGNYNNSLGRVNKLIDQNNNCKIVLTKDNTDEFYKIDPTIKFIYKKDTSKNNGGTIENNDNYNISNLNKSSNSDDNLNDVNNKFEGIQSKTDSIYDSDTDTKLGSYNVFPDNFYIERKVTQTIVYNKSKDMRAKCVGDNGEVYNCTGSNKEIKLGGDGYVYPISLTVSGNRLVYFHITTDNPNKTIFDSKFGANNILNSNDIKTSNENVYKCDYDISNDLVIEDTSTLRKDDYKKNFYIRSISTQDVDPNDRFSKGLLGANWANSKGQELIKLIQNRDKNKNTYNPEYLEYSFTLNSHTIDEIKKYNMDAKNKCTDGGKNCGYSDFNLECNGVHGECKSTFLNNLSSGKVNNESVSGVNAVIKRNLGNNKNKQWKYFVNGNWQNVSTLKKVDHSSCDENSDDLTFYNCIYRNINEGVLP